jgi:hypothetical protein
MFAAHMPSARIRDMVSTLDAYGDVNRTEVERTFELVMRRPSHFSTLKVQLDQWETYGFVRCLIG